MKESGFYLLKEQYIELLHKLGGKYNDSKERPIYCCIQDRTIKGLYWAIPTSDISHRTDGQMKKIKEFCELKKTDIRHAYYHIGTTNRPAIFKISNALWISDDYIEKAYISKGTHLTLGDKSQRDILIKKLYKILSYEGRFPNRLEQHITDLKIALITQLQLTKDTNIEKSEVVTPLTLTDKLQQAKLKADELNSGRLVAKDKSDIQKDL